MLGQSLVEYWVPVWLWGPVFKGTWYRGEKVGAFVEEGLCALGYELGREG